MAEIKTLAAWKIDQVAALYLEAQAAVEAANREASARRARLIELTREYGSTAPRAWKTRRLCGSDYEIRVSEAQEITVDMRAAMRVKHACIRSGTGRLFRRLFRKVETFILAPGAERLLDQARLPEDAPRNLRALFARAVRVRELAPHVEVGKREKPEEAA